MDSFVELNFGFTHAVMLCATLSAVPLVVSLGIGIIVSIFQAATQIQEQSLTFVPKLIGVSCALALLGMWMCRELVEFCTVLFDNLPILARSI